MKEHKMKKSFFLSTVERYKAAGYPRETLNCLHYLESRCERLGDFLEEFRHIQPDKRLFSAEAIGIIKELCELQEHLHRLEEVLIKMQSHFSKSEMVVLSPLSEDF